MSEYEKQAQEFLNKFHLTLKIWRTSRQDCPPWSKEGACCKHGARYMVSLEKPTADKVSFPFWGSAHDKALGKKPTAYNILACLSSDACSPDDPDEVMEEFGPMKIKQALAVAEFGKKLRAFFTKGELEDLSIIS